MYGGVVLIQAVIVGSGIDEMPEFQAGYVENIETRFGTAEIIKCLFLEKEIVVLPRHGIDHNRLPSQINYRAQIAALKKIGIRRVVGVCSVGSINTKINPGQLAVLGDFIDFTHTRKTTFFDTEDSSIVHTDFSSPFCPSITKALLSAAKLSGLDCFENAVYIGVEGPRYETPAEIQMFKKFGADLVGMTIIPEAILAKEAGLCYGSLAISTNYACGISPTSLSHFDVVNCVKSINNDMLNYLKNLLSVEISDICNCSSNDSLKI